MEARSATAATELLVPYKELHIKVVNYLNNKHKHKQANIKQISNDFFIEVFPGVCTTTGINVINVNNSQMFQIYSNERLFEALAVAKLAQIYCKERLQQLASFGLLPRALSEIVHKISEIQVEEEELIDKLNKVNI